MDFYRPLVNTLRHVLRACVQLVIKQNAVRTLAHFAVLLDRGRVYNLVND